jgi:hypothetical protein
MIFFTVNHQINAIHNNDAHLPFEYQLDGLQIPHGCKLLLANLFPENYIVFKIPVTFNHQQADCLVFEKWRITNLPKMEYACAKVYEDLKDYNNFSAFEQEVIYCFLIGLKADKEIVTFIKNATKSAIKANIRYTVASLYDKFCCKNRIELYHALIAHELDTKLPQTIFPSGQYILE